ncbi:MAG: hypothetical protein ACI90V_006820 [Bacillariaceae sp.]|jgi:hypothetical protein
MGKTSASRRGKKDVNNNSNKKANDNDGDDEKQKQNHQEETTTTKSPLEELLQLEDYWIILKNHRAKIYWILVLVGIPYALNMIWKKMILQHPQIILLLPLQSLNMNLNTVRPSVVKQNDIRQVLILGSMMSYSDSGSNDISKQFHNEFNGLIEIGYENSDTSWNFVRDGTVSWIHGIRYFDNDNEDDDDDDFIRQLCRLKYALTYESRDRYGFAEPSIFGNETNQCSILNPDSRRCELPACEKTLKKEYGCATRTAKPSSSSSSCDMMMPFQTTLLQTRQPWDIVRSLVYKYCWRSTRTSTSSSSSNSNNIEVGPVQDNMPSSLSSLFEVLGLIPPTPDVDDDDDDNDHSNNDEDKNENDNNNHNHHCVNQFIDYVSGYYNTILDNSSANDDYDTTTATKTKTTTGVENGITMYKIEDASICGVAKMAGLYDLTTTVYKPNYEIVINKCRSTSNSNNKGIDDDVPVVLKKDETKNIISVKRDLIPYTTPEHITKMKELFIRLNYEYNEE